jgi:hypothetical protein
MINSNAINTTPKSNSITSTMLMHSSFPTVQSVFLYASVSAFGTSLATRKTSFPTGKKNASTHLNLNFT